MKKLAVAVGDVHGCLDEFKELLNVLQYKKEQMRLVLLGDLMDRGPDSVGVVRLVRELGLECIKGNHEDKHLRWRKHEVKSAKTGKENPMNKMAKRDDQANKSLSDEEIGWMDSLPVKLDLENGFWAVHAGCEPYQALDKQAHAQLMRVRFVNEKGKAVSLMPDKTAPPGSTYWTELWQGPESIVYGHCVHSLEQVRVDVINDKIKCVGIDTGCCFGGHLTAVVFEEDLKFVQVKAKETYSHSYDDRFTKKE